jgi:PAS domain S-box
MGANTANHVITRTPRSNGEHHSRDKYNANRHDTPRQTAPTKIQNYHQLVTRAAKDAVRDWNLTTDDLIWRQGLDTVLGWTSDASSNKNSFWQKHLHPGDRARVTKSVRDAIKSEAEHWSSDYRFKHGDGSYVNVLERALIVRDAQGIAERFVGVIMDVTAHRQARDTLMRSQKMEAFGHLAAGVAHDFNNALTAILGYGDLIVGEIDGRSTVAKYMNEIRRAAARASSLTQQLLKFGQRQTPECRVLEVNVLLGEVKRKVSPLFGADVSLLCELLAEEKAAHVTIDPAEFVQVMLDLAADARHAMPQGGTLVLKADTLSIDASDPHPTIPDLIPGEYAIVSLIADSFNAKEGILEGLSTTKQDTDRVSLGVATCEAIIRQNGGRLILERKAGKSSSAHIFLPAVPSSPATLCKKPRLSRMPTGHETVLVVEDDVSVRHVTVRTLRLLGYNVLEATRADEARRCIDQHPESIDLVVSDIVLPDISGRDFAKWTRAHSPCTQIILVSGYLPFVTIDAENCDPVCLPKPFDPEQLAFTVRKVLDAGR